jgi:hypothetical protein
LTAGKLGDAPIFIRRGGGLWLKSHQMRPMVDRTRPILSAFVGSPVRR